MRTFRLCARPLLKQPCHIPHIMAQAVLREVCGIWRADPVGLEAILKASPCKEAHGGGTCAGSKGVDLR